ncbi:GNAT family N-acetyltransferase [Labedella endophytica]|uniref:GNAT family N-acetyltransferase n=1 Tax=Labedella endophytica TaxID=1523160 RepID=A0A433JSR3_9MICO|nr:GNAT family N-acetyltransferase [Labedella endophytica]RUR01077.1 GNAT family N-acetyltransferase [Labedella endophytica]
MTAILLRPAVGEDARFLADMLVEAANWSPASRRPRVQVLADPTLAPYVSGWMRPGDAGLVAESPSGDPLGACWFRLFDQSRPGQGFVAGGVPELTLGVSPLWRAQGVGRELLRGVATVARSSGYARLSLSVDRGNFAQRLYVSEGYVVVHSDDRADVMVRTLA